MPTQEITIKIDVPEGWEFVAYRLPEAGEFILAPAGNLSKIHADYIEGRHFIVHKAYVWPAGLSDEVVAIAKEASGNVWPYFSVPKKVRSINQSGGGWDGQTGEAMLNGHTFNIPHGLDDIPWDESLRLKWKSFS